MGTIDNVYNVNYLVNRRLSREKLIAFFVDLKAAFDSIDREMLVSLRERRIREGLVRRCEDLFPKRKQKVESG